MAIDFNTEPYFDDYNPNKDFYKVLFRPSYAVQARELTQLQTILQNQVSRFGDHVFKNGSQVIPGSVNADNKVHFIKLEQFTGTVDVTTYIETFKNKIITGETSGVKMRVLDTSGGGAVVDELSYPTLYCKIEGTAADTVTNRLLPGENIIAYTEDNLISSNFRLKEDQLSDITAVVRLTGNVGETPTTYTGNTSSDVLGYAYSVDVGAGIYYIDGIFVRNDDLKLYVGRFTDKPSCRVGFKVTEETITPEDDESILDNATGSYNFAAPGAHRYKISLSLVKLPLTGTDSIKFVELLRIVDGRIQQKITNSSYAELEKTLARRTYDESGNYEVNKFKMSIREHLNDGTNQGLYDPMIEGNQIIEGTTYGDVNKFVLCLDPGKAYVQGYEIESVSTTFIPFNKARIIDGDEGNHIQRVPERTIGLTIGNYVRANNLFKYPDIGNFEKVYLVNAQQSKRVATAHCVVSGGVITSVVVDDGGAGYSGSFTSTSMIQPLTASGSGANITANVTNGVITSFTVVSGGTGYDNTITPFVKLTQNLYVDSAGAELGNAPSTSSIVGTARVRAIQLEDNNVYVPDSQYEIGLFDIQMQSGKSFARDVKSIVGVAGGNNFSCNIIPDLVQIPGTASASTGGNTLTGQGTLFTSYLQVGDIVYINDVKAGTIQSIQSNYSATFSGNGLTNVTNGRITVFNAALHSPEYETLLVPLGLKNIKTLRGYANGADTLKQGVTVVRRIFPEVAATNNKVSFELTNTDETFLSDEDLANYTLVNTLTNIPVFATKDTATKVYITFNSDVTRKVVNFWNVPAGTYRLIASVNQVAGAAQEKQKSLDKVNGVIEIEDKRIAEASVIDLEHGDIFKLVKVEMTPDPSFVFNPANVVDITSRYELDNGQRSTYYTYGKIKLKPGSPVPTGAIRITYWFFKASALFNGNYFSVDSYMTTDVNAIDYSEIPSFSITDATTGTKIDVSLSDVLDFRPVLTTTNGFNPELPKIGSDITTPIANYVGRIDKIVLDSFGKFNILRGVPGPVPKAPEDPKEGMVLATVAIPPYTKSASDVIIKQRDNRRYTMRDIGRLERRVSNLEYYVSLSLLEKDTAALSIKDSVTGLDAFKNGFIVDQFTGHGVGDVKNIDYKCSVDTQNKVLRPMFYSNALNLVENLTSGSDRGNKTYQKTNDVVTVPYTESPYIFNNNATSSMDIHAISMGAFKGQITLFPEGDNWKSVTRRPDLVRVDDNNYDAIKFMAEQLGVTGTQWNEWQTHWTAVSSSSVDWETRIFDKWDDTWGDWMHVTGYKTTTTDFSGYQTRTGIDTTLTSTNNSQNYGDRIVDMSYIPYMRSRPVTYVAKNMKGRTKFYPFFDDVPVGSYIKPADSFLVSRVSTSVMSFDLFDLQNNILQDDRRRGYNGIEYSDIVGESGGNIEPAFGVGDILSNITHVPTNIVSIANLTSSATTFSFVVQDPSNIKPGNHVLFYNMNYHNSVDLAQYDDYTDTVIGVSSGIVDADNTSKQLNLKVFKVTAVSGGNITVMRPDGMAIDAFDAYSTASYSESNRGKIYRLKASGVVVSDGEIMSSDSIGPIQQQIYLANIKNGFAVGETLTGSVSIRTTGLFNGVTIDEINGSNIVSAAPTMKKIGDPIITDTHGTAVGVFYLPETDSLSFRTGERTFKLTDNASNSNSSFDSMGSAVYYAQGIALDKERTVVSSRSVEFVQASTYEDSRTLGLPSLRRTSSQTTVTYQYDYDPLAQTFTINAPGGVFATSLDLYFLEAGRRPISVELRPTSNGVPSSTKVIPFTKVTKIPSEIMTSSDSSEKTTFNFSAPVYLQDGETYAFVIMTDEPGAQVFVSEMGQKDLLTGNVIAGQPLTGSLYASQNAKEWEIHTLLDTKFSLNTAKYSTIGDSELQLRITPPPNITLENNPFYLVTPASTGLPLYVRVSAPNHGLLAGQSVTFSGVAEGLYGAHSTTVGIPDTLFNTTHTVLSYGLEKDNFLIALETTESGTGNNLLKGDTTDLITGNYGGSGISCTRGYALDTLFLKTSDLVYPDTSIDYYVKALNEDGVTWTDWLPFVANTNFSFSKRMNIPSYENYPIVDTIKAAPLQIKAQFRTSNPNISPLIDLQQLSAYAISNNINTPVESVINVAELDTRTLIEQGNITDIDISTVCTGTASATTSSTTVTGVGTLFSKQCFAGNVVYRSSDNVVVGTVSSVASDTSMTLTGNAAVALTSESFYVKTSASLVFENNSDGYGQIRTNIDTADNLLSSAGVGKYIIIEGVASGINGKHLIRDVQVVEDKTVYAGNPEYDTCKIILESSFSTSATIDMITDPDFKITMLDRYSADTSPIGASNMANYVTRTLTLSQAAESLRVIFDANIGNGASVVVYYRTWTGATNPDTLRWIDTGFVSTNSDAPGQFIERNIDVTGIPAFNNVQVKIVMKTNNPVVVPKLQNLRLLALS